MRKCFSSIGIPFTLSLLLVLLTALQAPADSSSATGTGSPITLIEQGPWRCRVPTATGQTHNGQSFVYLNGTFKHVFELTPSGKGYISGVGKAKMKYIALYHETAPSPFTIRSSGVSEVTIKGLLKEDTESADKQFLVEKRDARNGKIKLVYDLAGLKFTCLCDEDTGVVKCDNDFPMAGGKEETPQWYKPWASPDLSIPFHDGAQKKWNYYEELSGCTITGTSTLSFAPADLNFETASPAGW